MKYKVLRLFFDSVGGKDDAGKGETYDPNDSKKNIFPANGVEVPESRIKALSTSTNKLGYPVIEAEAIPEEPKPDKPKK